MEIKIQVCDTSLEDEAPGVGGARCGSQPRTPHGLSRAVVLPEALSSGGQSHICATSTSPGQAQSRPESLVTKMD